MTDIFKLIACCACAYSFYKYFLYPVFLSPLSKVPNAHPLSSVSSLWILWQRWRHNENRTRYKAHRKLGSVVRLGPSELSVDCVDGGTRTIYSGGFEKHEWYQNLFANYGVPNMFSTSYSKPHSIRKRMVSNIYSKSYLQNSSFLHIISQTLLFDRFLPLLESLAAAETPTDVLELNFAVTMDFIMAYLFGLPLGSNFIQDVGFRRHWLALYQNRMDRFPRQELPTLTSTLQAVGIRLVPKQTDEQTREIEALNLTTCTEAAKNPSTDPTVFSHLCSALNISTKNPADLLPVASETLDHLAAGHETSGITLTYLMHELSLHPALQDSLRAELLALSPPLKVNEGKPLPELPSPRSIDSLPLLHAILMETLRIHTAIPGGQPRITPAGVTTLGSFSNIPPDVRVSASGYTLHRNATVFPDPEAWKPERWLNASKEQKDEMLRWFWAFGSGGRMCVGSHFAIAEMKSIVGTIYTGFRTVVVDDEGMEQEDAYTASPKKRKLVLRFEKV